MTYKARKQSAKSRQDSNTPASETSAQGMNYSAYPSASLWRRIAAMVYDQLVLWAIWIATGFVHAMIFGIESTQDPRHLKQTLFPALVGVTFLFYYWFWSHGGQTLGMRAWRLQVIDGRLDGTPPHWIKCLTRFFGAGVSLAAFGLGYIWVLFDPNRDTWHDRLSGTRTLEIPKEENQRKRFTENHRPIPRDPS